MGKNKLKKLIIYLSKDRLDKYYDIANQNLKTAIKLYRKDLKYCQKFYLALNLFEIILRNTVNNRLMQDFETDWYNSHKINFSIKQLEIIDKIKSRILEEKKNNNNSNTITKLTFGFWCSLFDGKHDIILWRTSLYKVFQNTEKIPNRKKIRDYLQKLRRMRNRISHCECIIQYPIKKYYNNLLEFLNWIDEDIAEWVKKEVDF